ncbi:MAG: sugar ABC transporter ATP-binding protein [Butyricicoccus sp.]|nr:sugar ABC transporter ATP-binding protein [Butyricicoccus sp.]
MRNISKSFPGVKALDGVELKVEKGTVHAVMGENGAGKSTLMKVLFGQYAPDEGEIIFEGNKVAFKSVKEAVSCGISMIYQELSPIKELSIAENVFVGRYPKTSTGFIDWNKMYASCQEIFDHWGLQYDPRAKIKTLKTADVQMIEIIKAISFNAKLVIMDEPSSSISQREVEKLYDFIRALKAEGITIIIITHKLEEVFTISDEVTVLRDGKYIGTNPIGELDRAKLIKMMVGREMNNVFPQKDAGSGAPLLEIRGLNNGPKVRDVSFTLHEGEILGFAGIVGAGRTETMRAIFGLDSKVSGEIVMNGKPIDIRSVRDAIKNDIVMATESRKDDGLVLCRSVEENIMLPSLYRRSKRGVLNIKELRKTADEASHKLSVKTSSLDAMANFLSGGNQQKLILCKWLLMEPKVLILDEPTRGIDVGAKWEIYNIIVDLAKQGVGIILVSSEMEEIINLSDRILVMCEGRINGSLMKGEATQEKIMNLASEVQA